MNPFRLPISGTSTEHQRISALLWLWFLVGLVVAQDLPATQRLSQFGHSVWRTQDGLFASPNAIAQTRDGYIWIGTDRGLVRFDGVRFVDSNALTRLPAPEFKVRALLGTRHGTLWVAIQAKVVSIDGADVAQYTVPNAPSALIEDANGGIWLGGTRGTSPVCHLAKGDVKCFGLPTVPMKWASSLVQAGDGSLWIGSSSGLCHWRGDETPADCFLTKLLEPLAGLDGVTSLVQAPQQGPLWVGIGRSGPGMGLGRLTDGALESLREDGIDSSRLAVSSILQDRGGALWIGTFDDGIYRVEQHRVDHYGAREGLSSDSVVQNGIFEDREGIVWVLTSTGIDSFRHQAVSVFSAREGLGTDNVESVLPLSNGDVWLGNTPLTVLRDDRVIKADHPELFAGKAATSLMEDSDHQIWIGLDKTLQRYDGHALEEVRSRDGQSLGVVVSLFPGANRDVWAGMISGPHRLVRIADQHVVEEIDLEEIADPHVTVADSSGKLWFGDTDGRLAAYKNGRVEVVDVQVAKVGRILGLLSEQDGTLLVATAGGLLIRRGSHRDLLTTSQGLPCGRLSGLVRDNARALWINASCGIIKIDKAELDRWLDDPGSTIRTDFLDVTDGAQTGRSSFRPEVRLGADGRVWFATSKFAQVVDPTDMIGRAERPVPVRMEELVADRKVYSTSDPISLPAATRDIAIRYTGLTFLAPRKARFEYRLEGRDEDWVDAGSRREAFYTDLRPGNYVFRARAGFGDGSWTEAKAISFEIPPLFYQTRWFLAVCALGLALVVYALLLLRVRQIARRLEQQMRAKSLERERIARNLHDTLLQDTQALVLSFQTVAEQFPVDAPARQTMERILDRADVILAEGRDTVLDLRDPEARVVDLPEALTEVGNELASSNQQAFRAIVEGSPRRLSPAIRDEAYSIGREAIINAFQHAQAQLIEMQLNYGRHAFILQVRDDGKGIDPTTLRTGMREGHWGLIGMRERAREIGGKLDIWSGSQPGTEIQLLIPARIAYRPSDSARTPVWRFWRKLKKSGP